MHKATLLALSLICVLATACSLPLAGTAPSAIILPSPTLLPPTSASASATPSVPTVTPAVFPTLLTGSGMTQVFVTQIAVTQVVATQVVSPATFCADAQVTTLINNFKSALQTSNGALLASLVSPVHGMDARLYRNGRIVNYDQAHAKFLFETTYSVDWGPAPGSGQETSGSFHQFIIPDLLDLFNKSYTLTCDEVKVGGASYQATWPYSGINYYSVYYPGTSANGNNDWHTWLLGMHYVNGMPYLYAIMQFKWEP
jgi:hypothetical protein